MVRNKTVVRNYSDKPKCIIHYDSFSCMQLLAKSLHRKRQAETTRVHISIKICCAYLYKLQNMHCVSIKLLYAKLR